MCGLKVGGGLDGGGGTILFLFPQDFGMKFGASGGGVGLLGCHLRIGKRFVGFRGELFEEPSVDCGLLRESCRCLGVRDSV
jgi:hypothetical protein